ncbi:hypothetical protein [Methylocucumis oryzae]|uniref:Uncharacterized protein n=1 Tax=Methylocucumis oryzae TaxID=1632867 RepID=A0A0F3IMT0_9GAMM|nr:hypothetical protein [Methylocucumis oryzae]KJV07992.1 hypothetical protein VZ94_00810 [Methylocucumis oryzae]
MEIQAKPIQWQDNSSNYFWDVIYGFNIEYFSHRGYYRIFKNNKLINNEIYESIDEAKSQCQLIANEHVKAIAEVKQDSFINAEKSERRARMFSDILEQYVIAMRAAVVADKLEDVNTGMRWIKNTLAGPGLLPDIEEAKAIGGAQAFF